MHYEDFSQLLTGVDQQLDEAETKLPAMPDLDTATTHELAQQAEMAQVHAETGISEYSVHVLKLMYKAITLEVGFKILFCCLFLFELDQSIQSCLNKI